MARPSPDVLPIADPDPHLISDAVPVPYLDILTYRVPYGMKPPSRGARIQVPLVNRLVTGVVVDERAIVDDAAAIGYDAAVPADKIKPSGEVIDEVPFLPAAVVDLALWVAEYYACGAGDVLAAAMPLSHEHRSRRVASLTV